MHIGVLALQGDYQAHIDCLKRLKVKGSPIRNIKELALVDGLILPGGESSVLLKLLRESKLWLALTEYPKPILGTCAGAILLAETVLSPHQPSLKRIQITVTRNAYGRQLSSHIGIGRCVESKERVEMVFIRAPEFKLSKDSSVKPLAIYGDHVVAAQEGNIVVSSFHSELSLDSYVHRHFIQLIP